MSPVLIMINSGTNNGGLAVDSVVYASSVTNLHGRLQCGVLAALEPAVWHLQRSGPDSAVRFCYHLLALGAERHIKQT